MTLVRPDLPGLPETVPARMVNEFVYCRRLFYLEWVQSRFATSHDVEEGLYVHRVVDDGRSDLPVANESWGTRTATSVWLSSARMGIAGRLDLVQGGADGGAVPVDYKKGRPQDDGRPWPSDRVQSLLQALLLRESGYECTVAEIWYDETRRRVRIEIGDEEVEETLGVLRDVWSVAASDVAPAPLVDSPKCPRCSLVGICLPDEIHALAVRAQSRPVPRRVMAESVESRPVYVMLQGSTVGVRRGRLEIFHDGSAAASYRLIDVSQVCLQGNVSITAQAMRELLAREVPVLWFSYGGWFSGLA